MRSLVGFFLIVSCANATTIPQVAGWTTIGINVLSTPSTIRTLKASIKKIKLAHKKKVEKKVNGTNSSK